MRLSLCRNRLSSFLNWRWFRKSKYTPRTKGPTWNHKWLFGLSHRGNNHWFCIKPIAKVLWIESFQEPVILWILLLNSELVSSLKLDWSGRDHVIIRFWTRKLLCLWWALCPLNYISNWMTGNSIVLFTKHFSQNVLNMVPYGTNLVLCEP